MYSSANQVLLLQDWSDRVSFGNMDGYREKFEGIQSYFAPRFPEATKIGNQMIATVEESLKARSKALSGSGEKLPSDSPRQK